VIAQGTQLTQRQAQIFDICEKIYQQQHAMYVQKTHRIGQRIVSFQQPYVRPIGRGKVKKLSKIF
jgi:hypothetical protein